MAMVPSRKIALLFLSGLAAVVLRAGDVSFARSALFPGFDGKWCKVQPSVASDGKGTALLTYQMLNLSGSDVFSGQYVSRSGDGGRTWSKPARIPESADVRERGLRVARYVNVHYSTVNRKWYATGMATMYDGDAHPFQKYVDGHPYCYPVQAEVDAAKGTVTRIRKLPFPFEYEHCARFGQIVECEDGELLLPFYFRPVGAGVRSQSVIVRYRLGKNGLEVVRAGVPVADPKLVRGIGEPSLVKFGNKYHLTLRTDECGMHAESDDGLVFSDPVKWTWTDGTPIGNANTQQHWVPVGDKLYLAYTRVTPTNGHVFRNRAPIFLAEFDPKCRGLKRETEVPVVPERGARLGNFVVAPGAGDETWLIAAEWMQPAGCGRYGSDNSLWLVRFRAGDPLARHRGVLCLTFDDGHFDSWRKALPLFDRYGARATFFVNGEIGKRQVDALREFQSYGHSVGLHGRRHERAVDRVAQIGLDAYLKEEVEPQVRAVRAAKLDVRNWAYPMSTRNAETDRALGRTFARMRTGHIFNRDPSATPLATCDDAFLPRTAMETERTLPGVGFGSRYPGIAEDLEKGLERLAARDELLVLYSHDILPSASDSRNDTSLAVIGRILAKADELGVAVVGFDDLPAPAGAVVRAAEKARPQLPAFWPTSLADDVLWSRCAETPFDEATLPKKPLTGKGEEFDLVNPRTFALWFRMDSVPEDHNYFLSVNGQIGPKTWDFINVHQRKVYCWGGQFRDPGGRMAYNRGLKTQAYRIPGNGNKDLCKISDFFEQCPTGRWHQIVLSSTRNGATFYLNGKPFSSIVHTKPITKEANLRNFGFCGDGDVRADGVVVFEGALSAEQVAAAYRRGKEYLERKEDMKEMKKMMMALSLGAAVTTFASNDVPPELDRAAKTVFAVPISAKEPSLETFDPAEWRDAVKFPAFHKFRAEGWGEPRRGETYVTATENAFFCAVVSERAPDGSLALSGKKDVTVMQDDVAEVFLRDAQNDITYQIMVASDDRVTYNAGVYRKDRQPPEDWKRFVRVKNLRIGKDWVCLVRFDAALGARKATEGAWGVGAARDWQRPFHFTCAPTWVYGAAKMRFAKGNPAVQFTFTEPPHNKQTITGKLAVRNTSDRAKTFAAVLCVPSDGMPEHKVEKKLEVAPGATAELPIDTGVIKISNVRYEFHIEVSDESGCVYAQDFNWRKPFDEPIWDVSDKPPLPFDFQFAFYPTTSQLRLTTVVRATKNVPEKVLYVVRDAKTQKEVARLEAPSTDGAESWLKLPELNGDYVIEQVAGAAVEKKTFERHRFAWEGNSLGKSRKVYAPFEPITVEGKVLKTVLREHTLGENGLPAQIRAAGHDLMAAPIRLVANGETVKANLSFVEKSEDRVITKSELAGKGFAGEAVATWEYDGCLKYELFLREGTLDDLTLEMPFKDAEAPCLHALGVMRAADTIRLPKTDGLVWDSKHLRTLVLANFANYVFIGNAFRGLSYWMENDKGWGWDRATANTDVVRRGDVVTARLHLVNKKTTVTEPRRILLGFQAGPVKPGRKLWEGLPAKGRSLLTDCRWIGGPGDCGSHAPFNKDIRFFEFIRDVFLPGHPKPDKAFRDELHQKVDAVMKDYRGGEVYAKKLHWSIDWLPGLWRADGKQGRPIFYYNRAVWNDLEEFRTYMNEWSSENTYERGQKPCVDEVNVTMVDTFLDFVLYYYNLSFDYGNGAVYCDNYYPRPSWNLAYPECYRDPETGKIVGASAFWTMREHAKRIFVLMSERKDVDPFFYPHMTSAQILPLMGFAQAQLDWEDKGGMGPVQTRWSPDFVQMVSTGVIVGAYPCLLSDRGVAKTDKEFVARTYCAVPLVHAIPFSFGGKEVAPWAECICKEYVTDPRLDLHRYFDEGDPVVKVSDPDVKWCVYRIPGGKTVILFVSYADHPLKCTFTVDDSLGLKDKKITDLDTKQPGSYALDFKRDYEAVCLEFK